MKTITATTTTMVAVALVALTGCGPFATGNGNVYEEQRALPAFSDIQVESDLKVEVWVGPSQTASVNADENLHDIIRTEVRGSQLRIYTEADILSGTREVRLTVPALYAISGSGDAELTVRGVATPTLAINLSGGATLDISGGTDQVQVNASGDSELHGRGLTARNADISASGGSTVELSVTDRLDVDASGGSDVTAYGNPALVSPHITGDSELHFE